MKNNNFKDKIGDSHTVTFQGCREIPGWGGVYLINSSGRVYRKQLRLLRTANGLERRVRLKELQPQANGRKDTSIGLCFEGRRQSVSIGKLLREIWNV